VGKKKGADQAEKLTKIWINKRMVPVRRTGLEISKDDKGVEYRLLEAVGDHPEGQMFIGYVSEIMSSKKVDLVQIVRWVPGIYRTDLFIRPGSEA